MRRRRGSRRHPARLVDAPDDPGRRELITGARYSPAHAITRARLSRRRLPGPVRRDDPARSPTTFPNSAIVDPDSFAICLATSDGYVYEAGDSRKRFAIQSVSKPFTYALALADRGLAAVAAKVDVEPSGEPFNEISLDPITERPRNPMINAGAITCASLIAGDSAEERFERIRSFYSRFAGRELTLDQDMFDSEDRTGNRNRAIGYMLRSFGILDEDPQTTLAVYFRQCSIEVDCRDLSMMAATLADSGINPVTDERVLDPALTERVLSVMTTCGMYNAAGDWVTEVGLPAKSGVGGGILAVLPGQIGLAVFSPRLDEHGNSVRGVQACRRLSKDLELHFMHVSRAARSAVRASYDVVEAPSRRRRSPQEQAVLLQYGRRARVYELHGDLLFAGAESVIREITDKADDLDLIVLDVRGRRRDGRRLQAAAARPAGRVAAGRRRGRTGRPTRIGGPARPRLRASGCGTSRMSTRPSSTPRTR